MGVVVGGVDAPGVAGPGVRHVLGLHHRVLILAKVQLAGQWPTINRGPVLEPGRTCMASPECAIQFGSPDGVAEAPLKAIKDVNRDQGDLDAIRDLIGRHVDVLVAHVLLHPGNV